MRIKEILDTLISSFKILLVLPVALIARIFYPNVWLISERADQARDNGYVFFKYLCREKSKELSFFYIIDTNSGDYKKIEQYKDHVINVNTWKHYFFYCVSKIHISSHRRGCRPSNARICECIRSKISIRDVFIPHGVSYGIAEFCFREYAKIDLFITSGKPEYDNVLANYGYSAEQVVCTGFPRLDEWHHLSINSKQIVLMPTWRLYLAQNPEIIFEETDYYKAYQSLISDMRLKRFLIEKDLKLIFYLHHNMQKYVGSFHTENPNTEIITPQNDYDIQELLKESALLITDYSSVHFDFAYMGKPVLYYQFDRDEFRQKQYGQSDFDAAKDGFGPVAYTKAALLTNLKHAYVGGFRLEGEYEKRMKAFYLLRDEHNCDRVYKEIIKRWGVKK